jgi:hypothetical protein
LNSPLVYDHDFDLFSEDSQIWLNHFINTTLASRRDLFLVDEIVKEWKAFLVWMQWLCAYEHIINLL